MSDLAAVFQTMAGRNLDFWGISYGETQEDITGFNRYGYIPNHLQSYFLVIEPLLLQSEEFYDYWEVLTDTDSRKKLSESMKRLLPSTLLTWAIVTMPWFTKIGIRLCIFIH